MRYIVACSEEEMERAVEWEEAKEERLIKWVWNETSHGFFLEKILVQLFALHLEPS